jgi:hypothetical protein
MLSVQLERSDGSAGQTGPIGQIAEYASNGTTDHRERHHGTTPDQAMMPLGNLGGKVGLNQTVFT